MELNIINLLSNLHNSKRIYYRLLWLILEPFSFLYCIISSIRNLLFYKNYLKIYKISNSDIKVISIGNITAGGTGKTPTTIWVANKIKNTTSYLPIILSRGYGEDEKYILKNKTSLPYIANSKRVKGALQGLRLYKTSNKKICFILDDGFQHRYIHRDLDIVLIDALNPFGFSSFPPKGILREPLIHLKRADIIIITKSDLIKKEKLDEIIKFIEERYINLKKTLIIKASHSPNYFINLNNSKKDLNFIKDKKILIFCGIGNPLSFVNILENLGCNIKYKKFFPDHYKYSYNDIINLIKKSEELSIDYLITTEKDSVKLEKIIKDAFIKDKIWSLSIKLKIIEKEFEFDKILFNILKY